jgi:Tol biopolymer transport system component/DNA-binding winged helix-turn-helix (wHTH) protein
MQKVVQEYNGHIFEFSSFRLDVSERRLFLEDQPVSITPKVFDTLLILVVQSGHLVEKQELMNRLWPDSYVEEGALTRNISDLRKVLGEKASGHKLIETVPKRGYRFVGEVRQIAKPFDTTEALQLTEKSQPPQIALPGSELPSTVPIPGQPDPLPPPAQMLWKTAVGLLILCLLVAGWWWGTRGNEDQPPPDSAKELPPRQLSRLTTSSDVFETALTPDGKWVAYVRGEVGKQSLWVKHLEAATELELIPPAAARYRGLTFSPDGKFIYYAQRLLNQPEFALYQMPRQGGLPIKLLTGIHSAVTFSPNGGQMAFVREQSAQGESALVIANADGSGIRTLKVHQTPEFYSVDGASWSPDGKMIATALGGATGEFYYRIVLTQLADGSEQPLGTRVWDWVMRVAWLSDGSGVLLVGRDKSSLANQIWQLNYPSGAVQRIVNDLNDYRGLSLAADAKSLVTVQSEARASIWVVPVEQPDRATQISTNPASQTGYNGLDWTPDGKIVYTARTSSQQYLWLMNADGSAPKQLTHDPADHVESPSVSGDGRYLVFTSARSGVPRVWRMHLDGSQPQELTKGNLDLQPDCSPDGQWVVYSSTKAGQRVIWKISPVGLAAGEPVQLTDKLTDFPVLSPDGKFLVCNYQEKADAPPQIALFPFAGGLPIQLLPLPVFPKQTVRWHPHGKALSFLQPEDNSSNVWLQPLNGTAPTPVTRFQGEHIFAHAWSPDGRYLACSRGVINRDIVMIKDFR